MTDDLGQRLADLMATMTPGQQNQLRNEARTLLAQQNTGVAVFGEQRMRASALISEALRMLIDADTKDETAQLQDARRAAAERLTEARAEAERLAGLVDEAIAAERAAEDDYRGARTYHGGLVDAERQAATTRRTPEAQTDALLKIRAAADVEARALATAEGTHAARVAAEQAAEVGHRAVVNAESDDQAAQDALDNRTPPKLSEQSILLAVLLPAAQLREQSPESADLIAGNVSMLASAFGVTTTIRRAAVAEFVEEQRKEALRRPVYAVSR